LASSEEITSLRQGSMTPPETTCITTGQGVAK
jgi:hypothetical protein